MTHYDPANDERLADWVDGRLGEVERERLEAEFRVHPELRDAAERYRRGVETMRAALAEERTPPGLADRIMAHVAADTERRPRRWVPMLGSLAAAAALVLAFFWVRSGLHDRSRTEDVALRPASEAVDTAPASKAAGNEEPARPRRGAAARSIGEPILHVEAEKETEEGTATPPTAPAPESSSEMRAAAVDERDRVVPEGEDLRRSAGLRDRAEELGARAKSVERDWSAGGAEDVIVVVELPIGEPLQFGAGRVAVGDDQPEAGVAVREQPQGDHYYSMPTEVQQIPAGALARDVGLRLLKQAVTSEELWHSNVTAPQVFALPQLADDAEDARGKHEDQKRQTEAYRVAPSTGETGKLQDALGAVAGDFETRPEDQTFQVVGDAEQVTLLVRELSRQTRAVGGRVRIERTSATRFRAQQVESQHGLPAGSAGFLAPADAAPLTWVVVRRVATPAATPVAPPGERAAIKPEEEPK